MVREDGARGTGRNVLLLAIRALSGRLALYPRERLLLKGRLVYQVPPFPPICSLSQPMRSPINFSPELVKPCTAPFALGDGAASRC